MNDHACLPPTYRCVPDTILPERGRVLVLDGVFGMAKYFANHPWLELIASHNVALSDFLLTQIAPDIILAPVLGRSHDILEVAQSLHGCGYTGLLFGVSPPLLRPRLVVDEVRAQCPAIRFCVIERVI